jgi:hypothetical protein
MPDAQRCQRALCAIRLGITGLEGLFWPNGHRFGGEPRAALEPAVEHEFQANGVEDDRRAGVAEAWTVMRRALGLPSATDEAIAVAIREACR